jgi:hypothetical protein
MGSLNYSLVLLNFLINWLFCGESGEMSVKAARRFYRVSSGHDLQLLERRETATAENRWTFEVAWEVANKGNKFIQDQ